MRPFPRSALIFLAFGLICGAASSARAQVAFQLSGTGGCFLNSSSTHTDCAAATFSLMTGGSTSTGTPGNVITGTSASSVTGLQIVIHNTSTLATYANQDLLTGFFWGISGSPTLYTTTGKNAFVGGSAYATNSKSGSQAIVNQVNCSTSCAGSSVNVGAYWASSYKVGGWSGSGNTFAGSYALATSGYSGIALGGGTAVGSGAPTYTNGNSSNNFSLVGSANLTGVSTPTQFPLSQDTVTIQLAFASTLASLNLATDLTNVFFTYGTLPDVASAGKKASEPASIALFGIGALALGAVRQRKRREQPV